jgi:hypothetical protein
MPMIMSGAKKHTIRSRRAHPDKPGNTLHLYIGLRTRGVQLLKRVPCVRVEEIEIRLEGSTYADVVITIDGVDLCRDECETLAVRDGFVNFAEMMEFWNGRFPFSGHIIHWA